MTRSRRDLLELGKLGEILLVPFSVVNCVSVSLATGPPCVRDGRFGSKVGQIGTKWDKSGAFSDQISVNLAPRAKCTEI